MRFFDSGPGKSRAKVNRSMRLLIVSAAHQPSHGGIGTAVSIFAERATSAGWHVELLTRPSDMLPHCVKCHVVRTRDDSPGFESWIGPLRDIHRIRPYRYGLWSLAVATKLLEIEGEFDAIEFVDSQAQAYVALTSRRVRDRWRQTPMYIHAHMPMWVMERRNGMNSRLFGRSIYHEWERQAVAAADGVRAPSHLMLRMLRPVQRHAVIPHLLPYIDQHPSANGRDLLCVGPVEPNKGMDAWAKSLNVVFAEFEDVHARLIGRDTPTGPDGTSMLAHVRMQIAAQYHVRLNWTEMADSEQMNAWFDRSAAVIVPSRSESFSYVAAEAIVRGVPVVVTDQVGISEYVPDLTVVRADDHQAMAIAQTAILRDRKSALEKGDRCRTQLYAACNTDKVLLALRRFISSLQPCPGDKRDAPIDAIEAMEHYLRSIEDQSRLGQNSDYAAAER